MENFAPNVLHCLHIALVTVKGGSDSKIFHENLFQIRNLIENLAPADPKLS